MEELMDRQMDLLLLLLCKRSYYPKPLFLPSLDPVEQSPLPFHKTLSRQSFTALNGLHRVYSWLSLS